MVLFAVGGILVAVAAALIAYITFVVTYWVLTDDPAAPVGTVREDHQ